MKVGFYGHVRQYHDLKADLDAAIQGVLESGEYVLGPALSRFEQELARVLTGVGLNTSGTTPKLNPKLQALYVRRGLFEFNPARHDANPKMVLGQHIDSGDPGGRGGHSAPSGFDEIEHTVTMLCRQPATARYISTKLATYFIADTPPPALIDRMARTFQQTDGSIAAVLKTMFLDRDVLRSLQAPGETAESARKFKDPVVFVISSLRFAYTGKTITNYHPVVGWLQQLGEPAAAREAFDRAIALAHTPAEADHIRQHLDLLDRRA